jgi:hypothetical protein
MNDFIPVVMELFLNQKKKVEKLLYILSIEYYEFMCRRKGLYRAIVTGKKR